MTFTDSELIIGVLDVIGDGLNFIGDFIGTTEGLVVALAVVGNAIVNIIGARAKEYNIQKKQYELQKAMALESYERSKQEALEKFKKNPNDFTLGEKDKKEFSEKLQPKEEIISSKKIELAELENQLKENSIALSKAESDMNTATAELKKAQLEEEAIIEESNHEARLAQVEEETAARIRAEQRVAISKLKEQGLSIRQISRLTGVSFAVVRKL